LEKKNNIVRTFAGWTGRVKTAETQIVSDALADFWMTSQHFGCLRFLELLALAILSSVISI